jgi:hypothetical protein
MAARDGVWPQSMNGRVCLPHDLHAGVPWSASSRSFSPTRNPLPEPAREAGQARRRGLDFLVWGVLRGPCPRSLKQGAQ